MKSPRWLMASPQVEVEAAYIRLNQFWPFSLLVWLSLGIGVYWAFPFDPIPDSVFLFIVYACIRFGAGPFAIACSIAIPLMFLLLATKDFRLVLLGKYPLWMTLGIGIALGVLSEIVSAFLRAHDSFPISSYELATPHFQKTYPSALHMMILDALVVAPFMEECIFQLFIQTKLQRFGIVYSILGSTFLFTAWHLLLETIPAGSSGVFADINLWAIYSISILTFACLRRFTGSLLAAILCHSTFDACNWFLTNNHLQYKVLFPIFGPQLFGGDG